MDKPYYVTPENFLMYIESALKEAYYPGNDWVTKGHPEDIATNLEGVIASVRGYLTEAIAHEHRQSYPQYKPTYGSAYGNYGMDVEGRPE